MNADGLRRSPRASSWTVAVVRCRVRRSCPAASPWPRGPRTGGRGLLGQTSSTVGDVALEHLRTDGQEGSSSIVQTDASASASRFGASWERSARSARPSTRRPASARSISFRACTRRNLSDPGQLIVDVRRGSRKRREKVGRVAVLGQEREEKRQIVIAVEALQNGASLLEPFEVRGVSRRNADRASRLHHFAERRDAEAAVKDCIDREDERDRAPLALRGLRRPDLTRAVVPAARGSPVAIDLHVAVRIPSHHASGTRTCRRRTVRDLMEPNMCRR